MVKRLYPKINKAIVLLPKTCCFCNKKFIIKGYKITEFNRSIHCLFYTYSCDKCASSEDDVMFNINKLTEKRRERYEI